MALRLIESPPRIEDYTLLSEYNAQTPQSFDARSVLHQVALATTLKSPSDQYSAQPDLRKLGPEEGLSATADGQIHIGSIDVWVSSKHLIFFAAKQQRGIQLLYQSITITAQDGAEVLLELDLSPADTADEDLEVLQLRIAPTSVMYPDEETTAGESSGPANGATHHSPAAALYKAVSDCQELNPDPRLPGDEDEFGEEGDAFDETAPGATGWITSENMADFMDENGNFRMPEGTRFIGDEDEIMEEERDVEAESAQMPAAPPVAGSVRTRAAADLEGEEDEESKWQRTG